MRVYRCTVMLRINARGVYLIFGPKGEVFIRGVFKRGRHLLNFCNIAKNYVVISAVNIEELTTFCFLFLYLPLNRLYYIIILYYIILYYIRYVYKDNI